MSRNNTDAPEFAASQVDGDVVEEAQIKDIPGETLVVDRRAQGSSRWALVLALVALVALAAGMGFGYQYWDRMRSALQGTDQAVAQVRQRQGELQGQFEDTRQAFEAQRQQIEAQRQVLEAQDLKFEAERKRLSQERELLQSQRVEMRDAMANIKDRLGRNSSQWMAAEAQYLMQVANSRLRLEGDLPTAIKALQAADQRLRDTGDPGFIGIRELLATEIAHLKGIEAVDRVGLSARIEAVEGEVTLLKLAGTEPQPPKTVPQAADAASGERSFRTLLRDSWEGFKSVMVIRRRGEPVSAMLPPEKGYFVILNLRLQLQAARLAMLRGDQASYISSLQTAERWLQEFFDPQSAQVKAVLDTLMDLQKVDLEPVLPDISGSLIALRERLKAGDDAR